MSSTNTHIYKERERPSVIAAFMYAKFSPTKLADLRCEGHYRKSLDYYLFTHIYVMPNLSVDSLEWPCLPCSRKDKKLSKKQYTSFDLLYTKLQERILSVWISRIK